MHAPKSKLSRTTFLFIGVELIKVKTEFNFDAFIYAIEKLDFCKNSFFISSIEIVLLSYGLPLSSLF